jgi:hypothetical protein
MATTIRVIPEAPTYADVLAKYYPTVQWFTEDKTDYLSYTINGVGELPAKSAADALLVTLTEEYNATLYKYQRALAYPPITDQLDMQYWDGINGTTIWADTIAAIKERYPKP